MFIRNFPPMRPENYWIYIYAKYAIDPYDWEESEFYLSFAVQQGIVFG